MDVVVVMPCRNAAGVVAGQLSALAAQETVRSWGVVVVDDGSTDATVAAVERFRVQLPSLDVVSLARWAGTGEARNAGVRASGAALILFVDADDEVPRDYVEGMAQALSTSPFVSARIDYARLNSAQVLRRTPPDQLCDVPQDSGLFLPHTPGGLIGLSRELFDRVGGLESRLPALADVDLCWRAQLAGASIAVADTTVSVRMRSTHRGRIRRGWFQGRDLVRLLDIYADRGARPVRWRSHLAEWLRFLARMPQVLTRAGRAEVSWNVGWLAGNLHGLVERGRTATEVAS